jgi:SAM-dependent methyltransferase
LDAAAWDDKYRAADRLWGDGPNMFVADRLAPLPPRKGLDLASGEGRNAIWLAERDWEMTAVDFSEVAIARGRSQSDRVDFQVEDIRRWEAPGGYDLVLIAYLHLLEEELEPVVKRAIGWLEPGGELFMIGHDRANIEEGHGGPQVPEILWDLDVIRGCLGSLRLVEGQVVRRPVGVDGELAYALDTLVRARRSG